MFTNEYIEKVSKAEEIQKLWKPKKGDWVFDYQYMIPMLWSLDNKMEGININKPIIVIGWLPTLEDLFGMLGRNLSDTLYCIGHDKTNIDEIHETTLKWVMYFVYNKEWNINNKLWEAINGNN